MRRMPRSDAFVLVAVTTITVFSDLAVAVISGVILSALVFAWRQAMLHVVHRQEDDETFEYFYCFLDLQRVMFFNGRICAKAIVLDFKHVLSWIPVVLMLFIK